VFAAEEDEPLCSPISLPCLRAAPAICCALRAWWRAPCAPQQFFVPAHSQPPPHTPARRSPGGAASGPSTPAWPAAWSRWPSSRGTTSTWGASRCPQRAEVGPAPPLFRPGARRCPCCSGSRGGCRNDRATGGGQRERPARLLPCSLFPMRRGPCWRPYALSRDRSSATAPDCASPGGASACRLPILNWQPAWGLAHLL